MIPNRACRIPAHAVRGNETAWAAIAAGAFMRTETHHRRRTDHCSRQVYPCTDPHSYPKIRGREGAVYFSSPMTWGSLPPWLKGWRSCTRSIVECTSVGELFENPRHPYTKGLLGAIPRLDKDQTRLAVIPGTLPDLLNLPEGCKFRERCPEAIPICSSVSPRPQLIGPGHEVACHACFGN